MTRLIFVGDLHVSDRPPLGRVEGYREQVLVKLDEVQSLAVRRKAVATVLLGDVFHSKRPMFTSHYLVQNLQDILDRMPDPMILAGNHDMGEEGIRSLDRQPLGVLRSHARILGWQVDTVMTPDYTLIARPYDAARDLDPSYYALTETEKLMTPPRILVCHGSLVSRDDPAWGAEYHHYALPVEDLDTEGIDLIVSGHIHEPQGPLTLPSGTVFVNPGSLARVSRKPVNLTRRVKVVEVEVVDGKVGEITDHELSSALPAAEVFLTQAGEDGAVVTDEIARFADQLAGGLSLEEAPVDQLLAEFTDIPEEVRELISKHLEAAGV